MNIQFRRCQPEDGIPLKEWLDHPDILRYFPMDNTFEVDDAVRIWLSYSQLNAALSCEVDGQLAGMVVYYLQALTKLKHHCLFAIINSPDFRGKGVGTRFLEEIIRHAKEELHLEKLHLEVYEGNAAQKLYERFGFVEYGRHEKFLKKGNEYITKIVMEKEL